MLIPTSTKTTPTAGFTLIEITIVVVIIAMLSTIAVFSYGSWRTRTLGTKLSSDLSNVYVVMNNVRNFSSGYPLAIPTNFAGSKDVNLTYVSGDTKNFCIEAQSAERPELYYYLNTSIAKEPKEGRC